MADKRYTIKIIEHTTEQVACGREWKEAADPETQGEYAYTPEIMKTLKVDRTILEQNKDQLDINAVIKAINGL